MDWLKEYSFVVLLIVGLILGLLGGLFFRNIGKPILYPIHFKDQKNNIWEDDVIRKLSEEGLSQSRVAFFLSIISAIVSFVLLVGTIILVLVSGNLSTLEYVNFVCSTLLSGVSVLFMKQAKDYRKLMIDYFDRLKIEKNIHQSEKICSKIENGNLKNKIHAILALNLSRAHGSDQMGLEILKWKSKSERNS